MSILTSRALRLPFFFAALLFTCCSFSSAANEPDIPTVDAGIGSCRADFTVKDGSGKPLYNAKIDVSIKWGFMNLRKTDLEASTNSDGQARFTGLPNFPKKPLTFVIKSGTVSTTVTDDPNDTCQANLTFTLAVH